MIMELLISMCLEGNPGDCKMVPVKDPEHTLTAFVCANGSGRSGLEVQALAVQMMESYPNYVFHGWQCKLSSTKELKA